MNLTERAKVWSRGVLAAAYVVGTSLIATGAEESKATLHRGAASTSSSIHEERFVSIGGIEQWITIKGASCANPVILFLHGAFPQYPRARVCGLPIYAGQHIVDIGFRLADLPGTWRNGFNAPKPRRHH